MQNKLWNERKTILIMNVYKHIQENEFQNNHISLSVFFGIYVMSKFCKKLRSMNSNEVKGRWFLECCNLIKRAYT